MGFLARALAQLFIRKREEELGRPLQSSERNGVALVAALPFLLFAAFCFYMAYGRR
ncbi:MAG: hypothetical protein U0174_09850 [Polyangiaceae bacterium]